MTYSLSTISINSVLRVDRLQHVCRIIGATPHLRGGAPISTVFIAPSGTGKSELILKHLPAQARVINDFTFASLLTLLGEDPKHPPAWIVVPDFNAVLAHKPHVVQLAMGLMLALMGEGVTEIPGIDGHAKLAIDRALAKRERGIAIGFISAMTPDMFFQKRGPWRKTGFLRRVIPVNFTYGIETARLIQDSIVGGGDGLNYGHEKLDKVKPAPVAMPRAFADKIARLSEYMIEKQLVWTAKDGNGARRVTKAIEFPFTLHKILRTYARASALLGKRDTVCQCDYDALVDFCRFVRYDRPEEL
jgi:hypothetical protein